MSKIITWADRFWAAVSRGDSREWARYVADEWEKRKRKKLEHIPDPTCWCEPELEYEDPETGDQVWVHREIH